MLYRLIAFSCLFTSLVAYHCTGRHIYADTVIVDSVQTNATNLRIVREGSQMGLISDTGRVILPIAYDDISFFNQKDSACTRWEGVLRIKKGAYFALFSPEGKPLTTLSYEEIPFMTETCTGNHPASMVVKVKQGGKYGLISSKGDIIIRPSYDDVFLLRDSRGRITQPEIACVRRQNKYGMMELRGGQILKTEYDKIEFLQMLEIPQKNKTQKVLLLKVQQNGRWGLVNISDKRVFPMDFADLKTFNEGLAAVQKDGKYGYIDMEGKLKINCQYEQAEDFKHGIALVKKGKNWGAITPERKERISFYYDELHYFYEPGKKVSEERAWFATLLKAQKNGKYGVLDANGQTLLAHEYDELEFVPARFGFNATQNGQKIFVELPVSKGNTAGK